MLSLTVAYLMNEKWYPIVIICISLIASEVNHLSMYLLAKWISSIMKNPLKSFIHFFIDLFILFFFIDLQ